MADKKIINELSIDYKLVGLASSLKEYKLCYHLNNLLNCDFRKLNDQTFEPTDRSRVIQFSVFKSGEEQDKNQFIVFSNKNLNEGNTVTEWQLPPALNAGVYNCRLETENGVLNQRLIVF